MKARYSLRCAVAGACVVAVVASAGAQPVFYSNQTAFQTALLAGGKVLKGVEDFEEAAGRFSNALGFSGPLDATTATGPFLVGEIEPNLQLNASNAANPIGLVAVEPGLGQGQTGLASVAVGANTFIESLDLFFTDPNKCAVGFDLITLFGGDPGVIIDVYGTAGLMGSTVVATPAGGPGLFVGVDAGATITRINIFSPTNQAEIVDNIEMWNANPVPEPFTMILGAAGLAAAAIRRRRTS